MSKLKLQGYCDEAIRLINRMIAVGETPTTLRQNAINKCIMSLKANNLWSTQFDVLVVTRGSGVTSTKMNWISNNYNAIGVSGVTYTANSGYSSDGSTSYLDTSYNASTAGGLYTQNIASWGFKSSGNLGSGTRLHGVYTNYLSYLGVYANNTFNTSVEEVGAAVVGYNCLSRLSSSTYSLMQNTAKTDYTHASAGIPNGNFYQLALNNAPAKYFSASTEVLEAYWMGKSITQSQFLIFQTIMNKYFAAF